MDPVERVRAALQSGELALADLTARKLGKLLDRTTSVLYRRWGCLDGFLARVAQSGMRQLAARGEGATTLHEVAQAYLDFALDSPDLYELMFHRRFDWQKLRAQRLSQSPTGSATECSEGGAPDNPGLDQFVKLTQGLAALGSQDPAEDARVLFGGLHGIASLAISERANIGEIETSDHEVARRTAHRFIDTLIFSFKTQEQ